MDSYRRALWLALGINAVMFGVEGVSGLIAKSTSLQADALDFLGDSFNYAISLFVLGYSMGWRASAAIIKGLFMGGFGIWVLGSAVYHAVTGTVPLSMVMGTVGFVALCANVICAAVLFRYRSGDSNMRSVWLCSRNDAISNVAVMLAAGGVWTLEDGWPDFAVAGIMAALALSASYQVLRQALGELRTARA